MNFSRIYRNKERDIEQIMDSTGLSFPEAELKWESELADAVDQAIDQMQDKEFENE